MEDPNTCPIPRWQLLKRELNNLTPAEFLQQLETQPQAILLDVRTDSEYADFHLPGARLFNYLTPDHWDQLEQLDPSATYFVYCRSGRRSLRTCTLMKNGGFRQVYNLDGGLNAMNEAKITQ